METGIIIGLSQLGGADVILNVEIMAPIEIFVYQFYLSKTEM